MVQISLEDLAFVISTIMESEDGENIYSVDDLTDYCENNPDSFVTVRTIKL